MTLLASLLSDANFIRKMGAAPNTGHADAIAGHIEAAHAEIARLRAIESAAKAVVADYPVAAGTSKLPAPNTDPDTLGYGSIKALRLAFEQTTQSNERRITRAEAEKMFPTAEKGV